MKGQWIGRTSGDQIGQIIFNVDELGDRFSGVAFTIPDDNHFPASACFFERTAEGKDFNPKKGYRQYTKEFYINTMGPGITKFESLLLEPL